MTCITLDYKVLFSRLESKVSGTRLKDGISLLRNRGLDIIDRKTTRGHGVTLIKTLSNHWESIRWYLDRGWRAKVG